MIFAERKKRTVPEKKGGADYRDEQEYRGTRPSSNTLSSKKTPLCPQVGKRRKDGLPDRESKRREKSRKK